MENITPTIPSNPPRNAPLYFIIVILVIAIVGLIVYIATRPRVAAQTTETGSNTMSTLGGIQPFRIPDSIDRSTIIDDPRAAWAGVAHAQAKVTVVEFLDFQCPFCKQASTVTPQLIARYRGKPVRFVFRHLPIESIHPYAVTAAHASLCAHEQNRFMPMHDLLYSRQSEITPDTLYTLARDAGLGMEAYSQCMSQAKYRDQIQKDLSDAYALGAKGTPTWFINGQRFEGALSLDSLTLIIDQELVAK